tara:strand:- start:397 stop:1515 length:1119 start_codon:yes stop_codon:yes gene_type:complete
MQRLYPDQVDTRVESMLEDSSGLAAFGVWFYNFIQRYAPWFHIPYFLLIEGLSLFGSKRVSLGRSYYESVVLEYRPHLVFSVHDCLNRGYFYTARELLGANHVRCATYCSEFSGKFGYSRNWVDRSVDLFISRTSEAHDYAVKALGLPEGSGSVYGQFLEPHAYDGMMNHDEAYRFVAKDLGLSSDRKTILLGTGGAGANNHLDVLEAIKSFGHEYQAIVVCGRNEATFQEVSDWQERNPTFRCHVLAYTDDIYRLMQVSDMILTRGGTTTCSEALHFGCLIVFNGIGGVMPQESLTLNYFQNAEAGVPIGSAHAFANILGRWARFPEEKRAMKIRFGELKFQGDPSAGPRHLVELATEAMEAEKSMMGSDD